MAALLTVNAGASDKVQRYISNCNAMGIEVMPPDVNASLPDFTPTAIGSCSACLPFATLVMVRSGN